MSYSTLPLSEAQILHLLVTSGPGVPPALEYPPTPPDPPNSMSPPWTRQLPARRAVVGLIGLGLAMGLLVPAFHRADPAPTNAVIPTVQMAARATPTAPVPPAISIPTSTITPTATSTPSPTVSPTLPPTATATEVMIPPPPAPRPVQQPVYVPPAPAPLPPTAPPLPVPTNAAGSGDWGNDWSTSIYERSGTIGAPTPSPGR
jgi:hypothetical protein